MLGNTIPMGPAWAAACMHTTGVGSSRHPDPPPRRALQHAPPSTLSSAWERLVEERETGRASFEVPQAYPYPGTGAKSRSPPNIRAKAGSPIKAKARPIFSWTIVASPSVHAHLHGVSHQPTHDAAKLYEWRHILSRQVRASVIYAGHARRCTASWRRRRC